MQVSSDISVGALFAEAQQLPDAASEHRSLCFSNLSISAGDEAWMIDECMLS